ncbi:hypothetical protein NKG94_00860 [Micromonospora sp. M12]
MRGVDLETRMSSYLTDRIRAHSRIRVHTGSRICELAGDQDLTSIVTETSDERRRRLDCRAVFCFIGGDPVSGWLAGVAKDSAGFVLTDGRLPAGTSGTPLPFQTSAPGSSPSATSARARRSGWPRPSATAPARSPPCTPCWPRTDGALSTTAGLGQLVERLSQARALAERNRQLAVSRAA